MVRELGTTLRQQMQHLALAQVADNPGCHAPRTGKVCQALLFAHGHGPGHQVHHNSEGLAGASHGVQRQHLAVGS